MFSLTYDSDIWYMGAESRYDMSLTLNMTLTVDLQCPIKDPGKFLYVYPENIYKYFMTILCWVPWC